MTPQQLSLWEGFIASLGSSSAVNTSTPTFQGEGKPAPAAGRMAAHEGAALRAAVNELPGDVVYLSIARQRLHGVKSHRHTVDGAHA